MEPDWGGWSNTDKPCRIVASGRKPLVRSFRNCPATALSVLASGQVSELLGGTSWSRALSRLRSATMRLSRKFSSSITGVSVIRRTPVHHTSSSNGKVYWHTLILRQASSIGVPNSCWRKAKTICSSVNLLFFMTKPRLWHHSRFCRLSHFLTNTVYWGEVRWGHFSKVKTL